MKKIIAFLAGLFFTATAFSQADSLLHPYQKHPSFPPVKLLLPDSTSYFTKADLPKKTPTMFVFFNPECDHCKHETEALVQNIDKFNKAFVVMATTFPFDSMLAFREKYKLAQYKNIVVAHDFQYFAPTFFMLHSLPFHAFYNRKKELISVFEGSMTIEKILGELAK